MDWLPCPLPNLSTILHDLPPHGFLGKRDLASGFHHVKLQPDARRFMAFLHPATDKLQRWVALPLGASQSPPIFVEVTNAAAEILQRVCDARDVRTRIYRTCTLTGADDFIILGEQHDDVLAAFGVWTKRAQNWARNGTKLRKDRGRGQPLQQVEFLGMLFGTVRNLRMEMQIAPA
jgi:hypothetical protein